MTEYVFSDTTYADRYRELGGHKLDEALKAFEKRQAPDAEATNVLHFKLK